MGDSGVTVSYEQSIAVVDLKRFRDSVHLIVLLAIRALTHTGDCFSFIGTPILHGGMKYELEFLNF